MIGMSWVLMACEVDYLAQRDRVGQRHHYHLRAVKIGALEVALVLGQPLDDCHAALAKLTADAWVNLDHDVWEAAPLERAPDEAAHSAVADITACRRTRLGDDRLRSALCHRRSAVDARRTLGANWPPTAR